MVRMGDVTQILSKIEDGDPSAAENLLPLKSEQTVMVIEQQVLDGYSGFDVACNNKCFNQAMVELLGYESRSELMATPVTSLYETAERRPEILAALGAGCGEANDDPASEFFGTLDFSRIALAGHSHGAGAVLERGWRGLFPKHLLWSFPLFVLLLMLWVLPAAKEGGWAKTTGSL